MAFMSDLVSGNAGALGFKRKTVYLCARNLRQAGLISQKGRGLSAAHMGPTDATNLLLGVMNTASRGYAIKDAPRWVRMTREATHHMTEKNYTKEFTDQLPPYPFLAAAGVPLPFGDVMDTLFDEVVRYGDPKTDAGEYLTNFSLELSPPGLSVALVLDDGTNTYIATYLRRDPRLDGLSGKALNEKAAEIRDPQGMLRVITTVTLPVIHAIAAVLRGYEPEEGEVEQSGKTPHEND